MIPLMKPEFIDTEKLLEVWKMLPCEMALKPQKLKINIREIKKILPFSCLNRSSLILFRYPKSSLMFMVKLSGLENGKFELILRSDEIEDKKLK